MQTQQVKVTVVLPHGPACQVCIEPYRPGNEVMTDGERHGHAGDCAGHLWPMGA